LAPSTFQPIAELWMQCSTGLCPAGLTIDLFSDPTFATFTDYIEAITPAIRRRREQLLLCVPCPQEINIPLIIYNLDSVTHYSGSRLSAQYNRDIYASLPAKASDCIECEEYLDRCPFEVDIIGKMHRAVEIFELLTGLIPPIF
jgi:hypothetical protein